MWNRNKQTQTIKLSGLFEGNISTRSAMSLINNQIAPTTKLVVLDFTDIEFISRSFAHELLRFIQKSERPVDLKHLNKNVKTMIKIVKASKRTPSHSNLQLSLIKLSQGTTSF